MKGESRLRKGSGRLSTEEAETLASQVLGQLACDADRLDRFLALSGLDRSTIRQAAAAPGFLPAVLDHVASDEPLLLAMADEIGTTPEQLALARHVLAPEPDWGA